MENTFLLLLNSTSTGFYLLSHHLDRLKRAIYDFQQLDPTLFPNPPSEQQLIDQLKRKVTEQNGSQRVNGLVCIC